MKSHRRSLSATVLLCGFAIAALFSLCAGHATAAAAPLSDLDKYEGDWTGDLVAGGAKLETVFHLRLEGDALTGTMDSPAQGAFGLVISSVKFAADGTVTIESAVVGGKFVGELSADGKKLVGVWKQRGARLPLELTKKESPTSTVAPEAATRLAGIWEGKLDAGVFKLRSVFHIKVKSDGTLEAKTDSPDQGAYGIPVSEVTVADDGAVRMVIAQVGATFEGKPDKDWTKLSGNLKQGGADLPLVLERVTTPSKPNRPQTPKAPFPYDEEEVSYKNPKEGITLAGTLTLPKGDGPFPAALLITGSGSQDRDETIFEHRPFLVIADHLTRHGIAVLRVDDRGVGGTEAGSSSATSASYADDVESGVAFLKRHARIRGDAIGLIGHSEGGLIAPMVAARSKDVAFIVMLAGPGLPGDEILYLQGALIMRANGATEEMIEANQKSQKQLFKLAKDTSLTADDILAKARVLMAGDPNVPEGEAGQQAIEASIRRVSSPWFRFFLGFDPVPTLEKVKCPVLALNGELDLQVPPEENLAAIKAALANGGNTDVECAEFPKLNHLFQKSETGSPAEYAMIEETFSTEVLEIMEKWITERTAPGQGR